MAVTQALLHAFLHRWNNVVNPRSVATIRAHADPKDFQPANITFDLLPALERKVRDRKERHRLQCEAALKEFDAWLEQPVPQKT